MLQAQSEIVPREKYAIVEKPSLLVHGGSSELKINGKSFERPASHGVIYVPSRKCWIFGTVRGKGYDLVVLFADGSSLQIATKDSTQIRGIGARKGDNGSCSVYAIEGDVLKFKTVFTQDIVGDGEIPPPQFFDVNLKKKTITRLADRKKSK